MYCLLLLGYSLRKLSLDLDCCLLILVEVLESHLLLIVDLFLPVPQFVLERQVIIVDLPGRMLNLEL